MICREELLLQMSHVHGAQRGPGAVLVKKCTACSLNVSQEVLSSTVATGSHDENLPVFCQDTAGEKQLALIHVYNGRIN